MKNNYVFPLMRIVAWAMEPVCSLIDQLMERRSRRMR